MASVNKVILVGRLGKDPELKYTPAGVAVANFSMATSEVFVGKDGQKNETTEWHNIVVWNKTAENCSKYLTKGKQAYIEGKLQTRSWDDKQTGQKRYATDIVAHTVQFLDSQKQQGPAEYGSQPSGGGQQQYQQQAGAPNLEEIPF
jgi:single-strand DNA-binding protein